MVKSQVLLDRKHVIEGKRTRAAPRQIEQQSGLVGTALFNRLGYDSGLAFGALFSLAIHLINFYPIASVAFPWFAMARNWISVFAHITFDAVLGVAYVGLHKAHVRRHPTG